MGLIPPLPLRAGASCTGRDQQEPLEDDKVGGGKRGAAGGDKLLLEVKVTTCLAGGGDLLLCCVELSLSLQLPHTRLLRAQVRV